MAASDCCIISSTADILSHVALLVHFTLVVIGRKPPTHCERQDLRSTLAHIGSIGWSLTQTCSIDCKERVHNFNWLATSETTARSAIVFVRGITAPLHVEAARIQGSSRLRIASVTRSWLDLSRIKPEHLHGFTCAASATPRGIVHVLSVAAVARGATPLDELNAIIFCFLVEFTCTFILGAAVSRLDKHGKELK